MTMLEGSELIISTDGGGAELVVDEIVSSSTALVVLLGVVGVGDVGGFRSSYLWNNQKITGQFRQEPYFQTRYIPCLQQ